MNIRNVVLATNWNKSVISNKLMYFNWVKIYWSYKEIYIKAKSSLTRQMLKCNFGKLSFAGTTDGKDSSEKQGGKKLFQNR